MTTAEFPEKLQFLFEPRRYKVAWGGRGGAKSWGYARALLIIGAQPELLWPGRSCGARILCAREIQKSLADSVHKLLADQIAALELGDFYTVQERNIYGANGTEFLFAGLKHNIASIKSIEACDIVWVEEAHSVSKESWEVLTPTIRKDGSEIWASFNPSLETDEVYKRFILDPPSHAKVVRINWQDNPWFPEVLRIEKDELLEKDPKRYKHIWEGECQSAIEGAVYAEELKEAETEGRITRVSYDRTRPVETFWDLGFGDKTAIWFAQALPNGGYHLIDYLENSGKTIEWYLIQMQQKRYLYGAYHLPWDGLKPGRLGSGKAPSELLEAAGCRVRFVLMTGVNDGINAARTIFPQCSFDSEKCADGLQALRHYQYGPPAASGVEKREPLHNWASHGADAFRYFAVGIKQPDAPMTPEPEPDYYAGSDGWMA